MTLAEIARALGVELRGDGGVEIVGVAPLESATRGTISFLGDRRLTHLLATTQASAVIMPPEAPDPAMPTLRAHHPYLAFVGVVELLHPQKRSAAPGVHPTAVVASTAKIGPRAAIGPHATVGERTVIGANAILHAGVAIYEDVTIGDDFTAHANVVVREGVRLGDRVTLHAGSVIGSDGFGYIPLPDGNKKIPQVGTVVLEDDVEIGACATIDRAALGATVVGRGTKIDNLVMVGHGCRIGEHCLLAGQVGLAGGTKLGMRVMLGGQAGSAGHLTIGDFAQVAAQAGMHHDIPASAVVAGSPAIEARLWRRVMGTLPRLPEVFRRLRRLERALGLGRGEGDDEPEPR